LNLIAWKKDKTNRDYLNEIRGRNNYNDFRQLTLVYEIVWYGDTPVKQEEFSNVHRLFNTFKSNLNGAKN
jgi:Domain of unknown function (DUF4129)